MHHLLLIDDDHSLIKILTNFLEKNGFTVSSAMHAQSAWELFTNNTFDLVLTDYRLPDMDGIALMSKMKARNPTIPVVLITNYSDVRNAVLSIKLGAFDYVSKPLNPDQLLAILREALKEDREPAQPKSLIDNSQSEFLSGANLEALKVYEHAKLVAPTDMRVLIFGESGTGKEHVAKLIHLQSKRAKEKFVAVDCGSLSKELAGSELFGHVKGSFTGATQDKKGLFELARSGTLFLDEIGNLPYDVQIQLLRAIEERKIRRIGADKDISVDVRIIAATNEQLTENMPEKKFRKDLYFRLNEFSILLPPLCERMEDIPEFATFFLTQACRELQKDAIKISDGLMQELMQYDWPGNLRELKNTIKRMALLAKSNTLSVNDLPLEIKGSTTNAMGSDNGNSLDIKEVNETKEKELIMKALEQAKYNKSKAAELLNIGRKTLYNKLKKFGLE